MNRKRFWTSIMGFMLIALGISLVLGAGGETATVRAISSTLVIGEVQTRGLNGDNNGANDEFVEIYNLSGSPVNLSGYILVSQPCANITETVRYTFTDRTLQPYGHYLIVGSAYSGTVPGDGTMVGGIGDCSKLQLQHVSTMIVPVDTFVFTWSDAYAPTGGWVGMEGAYFAGNPNANTQPTQTLSMARLPNTLSATGGHKNGQDTDVNAADFIATTASSPENMAGPNAVAMAGLRARSALSSLAGALLMAAGFVVIHAGRRTKER
jgi:hypothetical protein